MKNDLERWVRQHGGKAEPDMFASNATIDDARIDVIGDDITDEEVDRLIQSNALGRTVFNHYVSFGAAVIIALVPFLITGAYFSVNPVPSIVEWSGLSGLTLVAVPNAIFALFLYVIFARKVRM